MNYLKNITSNSLPMYLYVSFHAPHLPSTPAPWYMNTEVPTHSPRFPNYNTGNANKHWQVSVNSPMDDYYINASDILYQDRLRTLLSVDDFIGELFVYLENNNLLDNTYIFYTSDHGYHLGSWSLWSEKSQPYETDIHIPFFIRGPGLATNITNPAIVSNIDIGATILELAGLVNPNNRTTDGRSLVPLLITQQNTTNLSSTISATTTTTNSNTVSSSIPWRDRMLTEFVGWSDQEYLGPCNIGGQNVPFVPCPQPANIPLPLVNSPSNVYSAIRIINTTHNILYAEFRPQFSPLLPSSTNFTELYDLMQDPYQITNLAVSGNTPPSLLAQYSTELWSLATCRNTECP